MWTIFSTFIYADTVHARSKSSLGLNEEIRARPRTLTYKGGLPAVTPFSYFLFLLRFRSVAWLVSIIYTIGVARGLHLGVFTHFVYHIKLMYE